MLDGIQDLINKRADDKLAKDIQEIKNILSSGKGNSLLEGIRVTITKGDTQKSVLLAYVLSSDNLYQEVFDKNVEKYRKNESKEFLQKVEGIQDQIDELYSINS